MSRSSLRQWLPQATTPALTMLRPDRGLIEAPIRAEIFGSARFQLHGLSLGRAHAVCAKSPRRAPFFPRIQDNIRVLREAHAYIGLQEVAGHHVSPAGEWLLDNFHVVLAQIKAIRDGLPLRYFHDLPVLAEAHLEGLPRVYGIAWAFVAHTDSAFDGPLLVDFLRAYQQSRELNLGELWALPTTLRVVLLENLRRLSERVAAAKAARNMANLWCDQMQDRRSVGLPLLLASMTARGVVRPFALQVMQRVQSETWAPFDKGQRGHKEGAQALVDALASALPDHATSQLAQQAEEAADNLSVSNAITALRSLDDADWRDLISRTSLLMQQMQTSAIFMAEGDDTQDTTLHAIERLARRSGRSEREVATTLIGLMTTPPDWPSSTPGYWLRGTGCLSLRQALGIRDRTLPSWIPPWRRLVLGGYLGIIALASVGLAAWLVTHASLPGLPAAWQDMARVGLALLAFWPASEAVVAILNRLISESVPPRRLPRMAMPEGIPASHRVLVVIPGLLSDQATLQALVKQMERHYLANQEPHSQFALLTDFTDADEPSQGADAPMLAEAVALIEALEARHATAAGASTHRRFLLLHRQRRWSPTEQRWIGWERKRGKLAELVALLAGAEGSPFMDLGALSTPHANTPYVLTLDSDTVMPPGTLRELVGVAAHPINQPHVDPVLRRVVSGYGILQPRIVSPLSRPEARTLYHWLFAGQGGTDPYSAVSSEIYQDVFGEGTFIGKGLLHVQAMHAVLGEQLPEGLVLSHDLIEGCLLRCGGVSDVTLIEDDPRQADVGASRLHRWTRGDWQLLPMLLQWRRFKLSALHRWKMIDNLRRSLVEPAALALIVGCLWLDASLAWGALALVAAAFGAGGVIGAVAGLAPGRDALAWRHFFGLGLTDLGRALGSTAWRLGLLLSQAALLVDAMARALYRMAWSHRHLLQWTTTAAASDRVALPGQALLRGQGLTVLAAALMAIGLMAADAAAPVLSLVLCTVWAGAPLWRQWASRAWSSPEQGRLSDTDRDYLLAVARDTWRFFEQHVGPQTNHLPPDNVQTVPYTMVAERTSPTNIGLYLLTTACAREFGWISLADCLSRCEATLATLARMQRHRGHFLNWYDTRDLAPLLPCYVSTVDSGNLCGHLLALASACDGWAQDKTLVRDDESGQYKVTRLGTLAAQARDLAMQAEFGFLFDPRRRLMHIGYRLADQQLDKGYYDLLASEARLASLWAIAKGDIPPNHWEALGRPFYAEGRRVGMRSWSGSMFEYLMPSLVLDELADSVLGQAGRSAVHEQMAHARQTGLPWGMSESAYAASDHTLAYQYSPQGTPRLALRRTPPGERVVAPYATALAAMWEPQAACDNLRRLEGLQARGGLGFIEALDFTADRQAVGDAVTPVSTYMAHHQGMTIVALAHVLLDGAPRRWGMADARLGAVASLLEERAPRALPRLLDPPSIPEHDERQDRFVAVTRDMVPGESALPPTLLLSNGRYSVALRANGAGWSRFQGIDITRWRDDALRDAHGSFLYLRRQPHLPPVSLTQHPAPSADAHYQATFQSDRVFLEAQWPDLSTRCTVWVSPEDDIELRQIELWNTSSQAISLELMSVFEVCLLDARADETHPAFGKLFVQADWDAADQALYLSRQPRLSTEAGLHAVHFIAHADAHLTVVRAQTDRARWMGRHRDASHPLGHVDSLMPPSGPCVTGLDPVAALSMQLTLPANGSAQLTLGTAAGSSRAALETLVDRYHQSALIERSSLMSATFMSIRLREMRLPADDRIAIRVLTTAMAMVVTRPGQPVRPGPCNRQALWRFGVSGDRPLMVVDISEVQGLRMMKSLVQALRVWSWGGLACDLIVLNAEVHSYLMPLQHALSALRDRYLGDVVATVAGRACGLHLLQANELTALERATLSTLARVQLHADGRSLSHHVLDLAAWHDAAQTERDQRDTAALPLSAPSIPGRPSQGQFKAGDGAFVFDVSQRHMPPRPWINVLANPDFGAQVSETGAGYTWAGNSKLHQLTAWSNDPVSDQSGEGFFLQNARTREVWSASPGSHQAPVTYTVEHRQGSTTIRHRHGELSVDITWCVDAGDAVKRIRITLHNHGDRTAVIRVAGIVEWMMGTMRSDRHTISTAFEALPGTLAHPQPVQALLATQQDAHAGFGGHTAFFTVRHEGAPNTALADWTCDRRECFDTRGRRVLPDHLGMHTGTGLDPCAAATVSLILPPDEGRACVFVLGHADTPAAARELAQRATRLDARRQEHEVLGQWNELLGTVTVQTPDPLFDALVNRWLLYQTLACRLWARAGFYQAGGAFGFRDQLQDAMALAVAAPALLRAQLLLSASRQYPQGDVQHWWHGPTGAGVRTHCSDDLLWLPHAAMHYVAVTGDLPAWDALIPFIDGQGIAPGAEDAYYTPHISATQASLYEHCALTLDHSLKSGQHGLPLMGTGDWNDGMNRVGHLGQGESVWLGWFLCLLIPGFAKVARVRGDHQRANRWTDAAAAWRTALQTTAWDGEWFVRAYFDDGSPLGSKDNTACRIDLIAQAWSVLSGAATPAQQTQAMASVKRWLLDEDGGLVRLLDPPLNGHVPDAGYIQAYPPGVRENGGQYSHAAVWTLMAQAALGDADAAYRTFTWLSPAHRSASGTQGPAYGLEPYVMAGDVYTQPPYVGRGGWSWYTGSASWMHRAAIESICGLSVRDDQVSLSPRLPTHWPKATLRLRRSGQAHVFIVCAAWAQDDIEQALAQGAQPLAEGQWRRLSASPGHSTHLVISTGQACAEPLPSA